MTKLVLCISLLILLIFQAKSNPPKQDLIHTSCAHASYPDICLRALSSCPGAARTPRELAQLAVKVSLSRVRKASDFLFHLQGSAGSSREQGAFRDCLEQMADSVEDLSKTLSALQHLRRGDADFRWRMNNAETWGSAALANVDTCLDGFSEIEGKVRSDVHRRITNVARVTSNALYLINALDDSRGKIIG